MKQAIVGALVSAYILVVAGGCMREDIQTPSELTAIELQDVITKNNLHRVIVVPFGSAPPSTVDQTTGSVFSFSNGFVHVSGSLYSAYNLQDLAAYNIIEIAIMDGFGAFIKEEKALILFVK
ncbi:MAG TPA: hypothetical protein VFW11_00510 [Cyclobacteriaceae bacterium]|nr:hypothetical protein [Cyclobacteriaceae bacterium]